MDRKKFLTASCAACGAAALISTLNSCLKDNSNTINITVNLASAANSALLNRGGNITVGNVIIINQGNNDFVAFSLICTDVEGCIVTYNGNGFVCPCHNGEFSNTGAVLSGPPPAPLTQYMVTRSGNTLTVTG